MFALWDKLPQYIYYNSQEENTFQLSRMDVIYKVM